MSESRILPAHDGFVLQVLKDFRVVENGREWVARLKGEGRFPSAVFPELRQEKNVLVELIPMAEWERPHLLRRWLTALRLPYLLFSLLPLALVTSEAFAVNETLSPLLLTLLFSSLILIHLGCNLWGEYEDHLRGVDAPDQLSGSGVIQNLWIPAVHLRNGGAFLFLSGLALGLALFTQLPWAVVGGHLLWIGLLGALGAASYSGWPFHYKYFGLGEPIVFFLSGPVVTLGAALILLPHYGPEHLLWFALSSLPLSFLATLRLHGGNMQRVPVDTNAGVFTIARALGFSWSKRAYAFLLLAPFLTVAALALSGALPAQTIFVCATLPLSLLAFLHLRRLKNPFDPAFHQLRSLAVQLHFAFGLFYVLTFLLPALERIP